MRLVICVDVMYIMLMLVCLCCMWVIVGMMKCLLSVLVVVMCIDLVSCLLSFIIWCLIVSDVCFIVLVGLSSVLFVVVSI